MIRYLSLFSGIEAASVAWDGLGWEPMAFAEFEKFPSAVLAARFPGVPNLGDITAVDWAAWLADNGRPDVIVAGSPCQSFSVAGKRRSLEDARGNLALFTAELVRFLEPRVLLWENVPGVLNTKDNAFGCLLGELVGAGEALRPSGKRWTNAGVVSGPERRLAWRVLDAQFFGVAQRRRRVFVVACPPDGPDPAAILLESEGVRRDSPPSREPREGAAGSTQAGAGGGCDVAHAVMASGCANAEVTDGSFSPTLTCLHDGPPIVMAPAFSRRPGQQIANRQDDTCYALTTGEPPRVLEGAVRRLTPTECERIQGFPDGWTAIPWRGKTADECPDGPRYKTLGNSMAVPVMRWIGARIDAELTGTPYTYGIPEAFRVEVEGRGIFHVREAVGA